MSSATCVFWEGHLTIMAAGASAGHDAKRGALCTRHSMHRQRLWPHPVSCGMSAGPSGLCRVIPASCLPHTEPSGSCLVQRDQNALISSEFLAGLHGGKQQVYFLPMFWRHPILVRNRIQLTVDPKVEYVSKLVLSGKILTERHNSTVVGRFDLEV